MAGLIFTRNFIALHNETIFCDDDDDDDDDDTGSV